MKTKLFLMALGVASLMTSPASALFIQGWSGDGNDILADSVVPGAITQITPHSVWGDVNAAAGLAAGTAKWISYGNTGIGGSQSPNSVGARVPGNETAQFQRTFSLATPSEFSLWILADDTAEVTLTGPGGTQTLITAYPGLVHPCAPGGTGLGLGCLQADMGVVQELLAAGDYVLDIYAFQLGGSVFGAQYAFQAEGSVPVPLPETIVLLVMGLVGLATVRGRNWGR
jgi:hypothetical protein